MRNQYPGNCFRCKHKVKKWQGFFQRVNSLPKEERVKYNTKWLLRCKECVGMGNEEILDTL